MLVPSSSRPTPGATILPIAALIYLLFIIYGSLVPLQYKPRPFDEAWQLLMNAQWLRLGMNDRADWVANGLLYMPMSYLLAASVATLTASRLARFTGAILALIVCAILAVAVELAQVFFPPRSVTLNDIAAEWVGSATGIALWWTTGSKFNRLIASAQRRDNAAITALLACYGLFYVFLSLFPYDFVLSWKELASKLTSDAYDPFLARGVCDGLFRCAAKLGAEILAAAPLGALLWIIGTRGAGRALVYGMLTGLAIEAAQALIVSGISQGLSVITRGLGFTAGHLICRALKSGGFERLRPWLRSVVMLAMVPYLLMLVAVTGLEWAGWRGWAAASKRFNDVNLLPFYHYYYTSETHAVFSLLAITALYAPVGAGIWAWAAAGWRNDRINIWIVALSGSALSAAFELAKLFFSAKRSDPTDVLIAGVGAMIGFATLQLPNYWSRRKVALALSASTPQHIPDPDFQLGRESSTMPSIALRLLALTLAIIAGCFALSHPLGAGLALLVLILYCAILWRFPLAWVILLPALLPLLDLAPWTGRLFFNELDLLVLTTAAVTWWRPRGERRQRQVEALPKALLVLVGISYTVSFLVGLLPLQAIDANSFSSYYSHYNALRSIKGVLWAMILGPLLLRSWSGGADIPKRFSIGMMIGLTSVVGFVIWERLTFSGLFNFAQEFRVTGTFYEMHTGGAYLEAYLVIALSFVGFIMLTTRSLLVRIVCIGLCAGGAYAVLVTFSRAGYVALAVVVLLLCASILIRATRNRSQRLIAFAVPLLLITVGLVAVPILEGPFSQARISQGRNDLTIRESHWRDTVNLMDGGLTSLTGMGLGRFPETFFWKNARGAQPGTFRYETEKDNTFLRLGAGESLYIDQVIPVRPWEQYTVSVDIRSKTPDAALTVTVCEKALLDSFNCVWNKIAVGSSDGAWNHHQLVINSQATGAGAWFARRPVKLSLFNKTGLVDVDNVALLDPSKQNLVANGNFSAGNDYWFFATDNHLPWHIKNLWLHLYFEQGWLGLLLTITLLVLVFHRKAKEMWAGDPFSAALISSLAACLLVGTFDSVLDAPRLATLFWLLIFLGLAKPMSPLQAASTSQRSAVA